MKKCSICNVEIQEETPDILGMSGYGNPRYLCTECSERLDRMTTGTEPDKIRAELSTLADALTAGEIEDPVVLNTLAVLMEEAKERADAIADGSYDFTLDEVEEPEFELTEDLLETEEDRALDQKDEEAERRLDRFMNWAWIGMGVAFVAFLIWRFFF